MMLLEQHLKSEQEKQHSSIELNSAAYKTLIREINTLKNQLNKQARQIEVLQKQAQALLQQNYGLMDQNYSLMDVLKTYQQQSLQAAVVPSTVAQLRSKETHQHHLSRNVLRRSEPIEKAENRQQPLFPITTDASSTRKHVEGLEASVSKDQFLTPLRPLIFSVMKLPKWDSLLTPLKKEVAQTVTSSHSMPDSASGPRALIRTYK
jgi:regulator of replication initiation timing